MHYLLTVTCMEPNPKYDPNSSRYGYAEQQPCELSREVLRMDTTPEQFEAIRKAALELAK